MNQRNRIVLTVCLGVALAGGGLLVGRAMATGAPTQTPLVFSGTVTDAAGVPYKVVQTVVVKFYDSATAPASKCAAPPVQSEAGTGRFSVILPPECAQAVHATPDLWSEATVGATTMPRVHVGAVPYAIESDAAKVASGVQCVGCVQVAAMKFDQNVDLGGHQLSTGPGGSVLGPGQLDLGGGAVLNAAQVKTLTQGGNADALHTHAGLGGAGGGGGGLKFLGVTTATTTGAIKLGAATGVPAADALCAAEFGVARMCTTDNLEAMYPAPLPKAQAWVLAYRGMTSQSYIDRTGMIPGSTGLPFVSNCNGSYFFSNEAPGANGWTETPAGLMQYKPCNTQLPIACCGI